MFACSMYPTDASYLENVKDETVHQVFARSSEVVCKAVCAMLHYGVGYSTIFVGWRAQVEGNSKLTNVWN